ncbi:unnamed protein product [Mycena citricolor]|uniref:Uncharacterized protein n=1 Tax=Mycena citricolor TaxID=2018698 RepID=A0AAD2H5R7_9AGAR|nr:unnamed protein product [Mycena citricolor]CAK5269626.1 unnamed protein product [Mycena citricolor]CAK5273373.1 unnamed protein product [Mycena citricolor]
MRSAGLTPDVLRLVLEAAARDDGGTARSLARLSRGVQAWIDPILYSAIRLSNHRMTLAFLRTMEKSSTKPPAFFTSHVKALCILYDMLPAHARRITDVCTRIDYLTTWFLPTTSGSLGSQESIAQALSPLTPSRMSVWHGATHPHPADRWPFTGPLFSQLTHLTIVNVWEDWAGWRWDALPPTLLYISLDLAFKNTGASGGELPTKGRVAATVHRVLNECPNLRVCALRDAADFEQMGPFGQVLSPSPKQLDTALSLRALIVDALRVLGWLDHRILFFSLRNPVPLRQAHDDREGRIWSTLEPVVKHRMGRDYDAREVLLVS